MIDDKLVSYIKEGLAKGYSAEQLKNAMLAQNVPIESVEEAFNFIQLERHEVIRKDHYILLITLGILVMLIIYLLRVFNPPPIEGSTLTKVVRGFWPFIFPIVANFANLIFYRKSFVKGLLLTFIIILIMAMIVVGFAFMGYVTAA